MLSQMGRILIEHKQLQVRP